MRPESREVWLVSPYPAGSCSSWWRVFLDRYTSRRVSPTDVRWGCPLGVIVTVVSVGGVRGRGGDWVGPHVSCSSVDRVPCVQRDCHMTSHMTHLSTLYLCAWCSVDCCV